MAGSGGRLRVIAGELGGRRLASPPGDVRPSAGRTREALFSILGEVSGSALDLFCGSGALGIEALSRGASAATFVDVDVETVRANVEALGIEQRARIVAERVERFLRSDRGSYDLVLCDPPYSLADRLAPELANLLPSRLAEGARVIVESAASEPIELPLPVLDERRYGSSAIRIHGSTA
jgi:16S rRNA (guanine966-N2)-methyltransferase